MTKNNGAQIQEKQLRQIREWSDPSKPCSIDQINEHEDQLRALVRELLKEEKESTK